MVNYNEIREAIKRFADQYHIKNAYLFGSYASGRQIESSDLDLLVEFGPDAPRNWGGPALGLSCDLTEALGIDVDVIPLPLTKQLSYFRKCGEMLWR
ncbi:MAG: nucleotidyltransferase domain-containing protein [Desulfovibrio sp.]|jgi:predicted nucleotidyltransferase|nr:nucleotidyltransferase domain-containing protein [Desulfovibrio sp.]